MLRDALVNYQYAANKQRIMAFNYAEHRLLTLALALQSASFK